MTTQTQYDPPESDIARVLEQAGGDLRNLAVAYLRAQHRAKEGALLELRRKEELAAWIAPQRRDGGA